MKNKLNTLLDKSYSPYSHVKVSAVLTLKNGKEYEGVNIENASLTPTICAERTAIFQAVLNGARKGDFKEIHIASSVSGFLFPCGVCRQVMSEFFEADTKVHVHFKEQTKTFNFSEIMPFSVTAEDLK